MPKRINLPTGKVSKKVLQKIVFKYLGASDNLLIQGPGIGEDAAILDLGETVLIAKANPITGAEAKIGSLSVHINANDVAVKGAIPRWFMNIILLPEGSHEDLLKTIMEDMHNTCLELGITIIGGHTEITPGITKPIISGFMLGQVKKQKFLSTKNTKPGDKILLTKGAGIEGTGIIASDLEEHLIDIEKPVLEKAKHFLNLISVVKEAKRVIDVGGVHSIHTPTEGGIIKGLIELSESTQLGFTIYESDILIAEETKVICDKLGIDPLKLISSGSLIITAEPESVKKIIEELHKINIPCKVIGEMTSKPKDHIIVKKNGAKKPVIPFEQDELYRILDKFG